MWSFLKYFPKYIYIHIEDQSTIAFCVFFFSVKILVQTEKFYSKDDCHIVFKQNFIKLLFIYVHISYDAAFLCHLYKALIKEILCVQFT